MICLTEFFDSVCPVWGKEIFFVRVIMMLKLNIIISHHNSNVKPNSHRACPDSEVEAVDPLLASVLRGTKYWLCSNREEIKGSPGAGSQTGHPWVRNSRSLDWSQMIGTLAISSRTWRWTTPSSSTSRNSMPSMQWMSVRLLCQSPGSSQCCSQPEGTTSSPA